MQIRQIIISSLGNTLEWLDFGLFVFFAPVIGEKFFPTGDAFVNTLSALSVFAVGFICRPLGGILFGHAGDTHGRARTLRLSILMISLSVLLIGCLPTYQQIGMTASLAFVLLRMLQGISVGGEYGGVMIYLAESAPLAQRGFITSFAATGASFGFLLASLIIYLLNISLSSAALSSWGWRLPFLLVGTLGSLIFYLRFNLKETPVFQHLAKAHHLQAHPFSQALRHAPWQLVKIVGLTCMGASFFYVFFGYMTNYLHTYEGVDLNQALLMQHLCFVLMLFLVPLAGFCSDKLGRRPMLMFTAGAVILLVLPCFYLLQKALLPAILLALLIAVLLSSAEQGCTMSAVVENCPASVRYSGISFAYNLGNALFGGTAPLMLTYLTEKMGVLAPAWYLMLMAGITLLTASTLLGKNELKFYQDK